MIQEQNLLLLVLLNANAIGVKILKYQLQANIGKILANVATILAKVLGHFVYF